MKKSKKLEREEIDIHQKPKRVVKPMTPREYEMNKEWLESTEAKENIKKYWSYPNGDPFKNPFR